MEILWKIVLLPQFSTKINKMEAVKTNSIQTPYTTKHFDHLSTFFSLEPLSFLLNCFSAVCDATLH